MNNLAFYTAIFGDYDSLNEPDFKQKLANEADFYCFTDNKSLRSSFFKIILVDRPHVDPVKSNRYYKILSHRFLAEYDIVIYADANVKLVCESFDPFIRKSLNGSSLALFKHSARNCLYKEALWVLSQPKVDNGSIVRKQINRYRDEKFPENYGLAACTYLVRRHSDKAIIEFNEIWWQEVEAGSKRDQLSFDYVRWKTGVRVSWLEGHWAKNDLGTRLPHRSENGEKDDYKRLIVSYLPKGVKKLLHRYFGRKKTNRNPQVVKEINRLRTVPNNINFETTLLGPVIQANHRGSFLFLYKEIFEQGVYEFNTFNEQPYIIDCGVNIGMSVIYFKKRFPDAIIVGFEPDEVLHSIASKNLTSMGLSNVTILKKGVWSEEGKITFYAEGTDSGRIAKEADIGDLKSIDVVRLSNFIDKQVDFLKIDIEGAELSVIQECENKLHLVDQLFIEYHSFRDETQQLSKLISILETAGFRYIINTPKVLNSKPYILNSDYLGMDFLLNIYAFRK